MFILFPYTLIGWRNSISSKEIQNCLFFLKLFFGLASIELTLAYSPSMVPWEHLKDIFWDNAQSTVLRRKWKISPMIATDDKNVC